MSVKLHGAIIEDLTSRIWAMERRALEGMLRDINSTIGKVEIHIDGASSAAQDTSTRRSRMAIQNGVAVIPITGYLLKEVPRWFSWFGIDATAYSDIVDDVARALDDDGVKQILLKVDSPGGEVAGAQEAADAIFAARQAKPTNAFIEDLGASGAYWLASQGQSLQANENALVGSIGVYGVYHDTSKMAEGLGIKVHVIRSGEHKGMGVEGAEITDKQIKGIQDVIDGIASNFVDAVSRGRGMGRTEASKLATGQVWIAAEAQKLGLIDGVSILDSILSIEAVSVLTREEMMAENLEKEKEAQKVNEDALKAEGAETALTADRKRLADLKAAFPEDVAFAYEQYEAGASVETAKAAYADVLKGRLEVAEAKIADADKKLAASTEGADPVEFKGSADGGESAETDFVKVAIALAEEKGITKTAAMQKLAAENPEMFDTWKAAQKQVEKK
jgi:signal peptide peptidase SppA